MSRSSLALLGESGKRLQRLFFAKVAAFVSQDEMRRYCRRCCAAWKPSLEKDSRSLFWRSHDASTIQRALQQSHGRWQSLDIVVANVGSGTGRIGWQLDSEEWERLFRINLWASVNLAQSAIPLLAENRRGALLFISSITGVEATPAPLPYSAAKAALINYSKNLAGQVAELGVRVNCIAPGNIIFPGGTWEQHIERDKDKVMQMIHSNVPLGRFGTPEEIAQLAVFLCSDAANFLTGACFKADGGQTRSY